MSVVGSGGLKAGGASAVVEIKPRDFHCVEIYLPKRLKHLSELHEYLRFQLTERTAERGGDLSIDGFSIYEVDGAWRGEEITDERTLVIRILFVRSKEDDRSLQGRIRELGRDIAAIAPTEQEVLICHYPQNGISFFR